MWIDISDTETLGISPTKDTFTQKLVLEITEFKIFVPYKDKETTVKNTVTSNITQTYSKRKWLAFWSYHKIELSNHLFLFLCCDSVPIWPNVIIHHLPPCWQPANYEHMDRQALTVCEQQFDSKKMHNQSYLFCCQWQNYQDNQWPELRSPKSWTQ